MLRPRQVLAFAVMIVFAGTAQAVSNGVASSTEYKFEVVLYQGDPNGSVEAGTINRKELDLANYSGSVVYSIELDAIKVGKQKVTVFRVLEVRVTDMGNGAIQAKIILTKVQRFGVDNADQDTQTSTKTTTTIQSGTRLRSELGWNANDMYWVEVTIREAKK